MDPLPFILAGGFLTLLMFAGVLFMLPRVYRKGSAGQALVISRRTHPTLLVYFRGGVVMPVLDQAEVMDLSLKSLDIERRGGSAVVCQDGVHADITAQFNLRVAPTDEAVRQVAQNLGCAGATDLENLEKTFGAQLSEALDAVALQKRFDEIRLDRQATSAAVLERLAGAPLGGFTVESVAIRTVEKTRG